MSVVTNICWQILKCGLLLIFVDILNEWCKYYLLTNFKISGVIIICWRILVCEVLPIIFDKF